MSQKYPAFITLSTCMAFTYFSVFNSFTESKVRWNDEIRSESACT